MRFSLIFFIFWLVARLVYAADSVAADQNTLIRLEFVRDCLIPTGTRFNQTEIRGLSALQYDEKAGVFHAVSDTKSFRDPQWFRLRLGQVGHVQRQNSVPPCPVVVEASQLKDPSSELQTDAEGLAFDSDGSFFVSSEVHASGNLAVTFPEILHFSSEGLRLGSIPVPESYVPKTFRFPPTWPEPTRPLEPPFVAPIFVSPPAPKRYSSQWLPGFVEDLVNYIKRKRWESEVQSEREKHKQYVESLRNRHLKLIDELRNKYELSRRKWENAHIVKHAGVEFNTAFESLSFDKKSRILTAMVETSLAQDRVLDGRLLRLLRIKMGTSGQVSETKEFFYRADPMMRVSEILDLGSGRMLVLEINYDRALAKVFSRIYEVRIDSQSGVDSEIFLRNLPPVVGKRLVLDLNSIESRLNPNYPRLDNLEGMTLGPVLPSGHRSLFLVSDNNGNFKQITQFLIFKIMLAK